MVKMLDENLTFPCQFPVLVQISSMPWTPHLDLALTTKRNFTSTEYMEFVFIPQKINVLLAVLYSTQKRVGQYLLKANGEKII